MKRFHVHVSVDDISQSADFYSKLFGQSPSIEKPDYAKWMLDDPRINFAISTHGDKAGLDHFGFQADSETELAGLKELAVAAAGDAILDEGDTTCCYSQSNKHWTADPSGIAWEHYLTMGEAQHYGSDKTDSTDACCSPQGNLAEAKPDQPNTTVNSCC